jgi:ParB-like chromosome segregation protein Spo0J
LPPIDPQLRDQLRADIEERGVLVPIIVTPDGEVLDGRLRIEIAQEIGLDFVPKIVVGKLSSAKREDLRLCVNVYRRHLNRAQMREVVAWMLRRDPEASDRCVARQTGASHPTVARVRQELEAGGTIYHLPRRNGCDGKRYPSARKPVVYTSGETQAREAARLLEELGDDAPDEPLNIRDLRTLRYEQARSEALSRAARHVKLGDDYRIFACDFRRLGSRIEPGSADLLLLDPPWVARLGPELAQVAVRLLRRNGIVACYTGVYYMPYFLRHFQEAGLRYEWTVAEIHRFRSIRNAGVVKNQWTPILVLRNGRTGRLQINSVLEDVFRSEECDKSLHAWQQDVRTSVALVRSLCPPGGLVADVCLGTGSSAVATVLAGEDRRFQGCDIESRLVKAARARVAEALAERQAELEPELASG